MEFVYVKNFVVSCCHGCVNGSDGCCCESDLKLDKLKFAKTVKIGARFEKSEYDFLEQN